MAAATTAAITTTTTTTTTTANNNNSSRNSNSYNARYGLELRAEDRAHSAVSSLVAEPVGDTL